MLQDVEADVGWPGFDVLGQAGEIAAVKRTAGFLKPGEIAGQNCHDSSDGLDSGAGSLLRMAVFAGVLHQSPDCGRRAVWLTLKPFPLPRQKRDFARHDSQLWAARSHARRGRESLAEHLFNGPAEVKIYLLSLLIAKDQN